MKTNRSLPAEAPDETYPASDDVRTPLDWPRETGRVDRVMEAIEIRKKCRVRQRAHSMAGAASVLLIVAVVWLLRVERDGPVHVGAKGNASVVVSPHSRTLPDGSQVELREGSDVSIDFSGEIRRVVLLKGEAHFQVRSDPQRPFVVEAGGMKFRAVGTAFAVQLGATQIDMLVTQGRVAVERARSAVPPQRMEKAPEPLAIVEAGNLVAVDIASAALIAGETRSLSTGESEQKLAWRIPRLELNDTPLAEVVAAIYRHGGVVLELGDAELARVGISGRLRADNVEVLLQTLESNYGIQADRQPAGKIVLTKRR